MSALAKPCSVFTAATNATTIVSNEHLASVEKIDIPASITPAKPAQYMILFTYQYPGGYTKETKIKFATQSARNTSFTNWQTANTASVA